MMKPFDEAEVRAFVEIALYKSSIEKKLEETRKELQRLRKDWEGIFQAIGNPALILDPSGLVLHANAASVKRSGIPVDQIIGKKCREIFCRRTEPAKGCPLKKCSDTGCLETVEMEIEALNGIFLVSCTPLFDQQARLERVIHIATDITDRKRAEAEKEKLKARLQQARKIEAIGTMTAGIAHDYNNLLAIIMGNITLAKEDLGPRSTVYRFLDRAEIASLRSQGPDPAVNGSAEGGYLDAREEDPSRTCLKRPWRK